MNEELIQNYKSFLTNGKTERECVNLIVQMAEKKGFKNISDCKNLKKGDKVYISKMGKAIALFQIGSEALEEGINFLCAHIDAPRLDAKQNPLYEKDNITYLNTHYYGGIKKYQWTALPLAIHGVVCKTDGTTVNVVIGEDSKDPVFCISDILPHLAQDQMAGKASDIIKGEDLDIIMGLYTAPAKSESKDEKAKAEKKEKDAGKKAILKLLKEKSVKYNIAKLKTRRNKDERASGIKK